MNKINELVMVYGISNWNPTIDFFQKSSVSAWFVYTVSHTLEIFSQKFREFHKENKGKNALLQAS